MCSFQKKNILSHQKTWRLTSKEKESTRLEQYDSIDSSKLTPKNVLVSPVFQNLSARFPKTDQKPQKTKEALHKFMDSNDTATYGPSFKTTSTDWTTEDDSCSTLFAKECSPASSPTWFPPIPRLKTFAPKNGTSFNMWNFPCSWEKKVFYTKKPGLRCWDNAWKKPLAPSKRSSNEKS